jgi:PEP-CTERM motif
MNRSQRATTNLLASAIAVTTIVVSPAHAAQVFATSYDTPNGDGNMTGGSFNYWDLNYSGSGSTTTDGAALSGGLGDLTDGVIATDAWFNLENIGGTGPFVGWNSTNTLNPLLTFNFAGSPSIGRIKFYFDDSAAGGVFAPDAIWINGVNTSYTPPPIGGPSLLTVDLNGLNLTGNQNTIQFFQRNGGNSTWTFVSEIEFFERVAGVPEPASWALMIAGFGLVGSAARRRKKTIITYA